MPVLIEGISVVIRVRAILSNLKDGPDAFFALVPNQTFCTDHELVRVGFMAPTDAEAFVEKLMGAGLTHLKDRAAVDFVVVDQLSGPKSFCPWIDFGHTYLDSEGTQEVAVCIHKRSQLNTVAIPPGWTYASSLSKAPNAVYKEQFSKALKYLRSKDGVDVYLDLETGKERYIGRAQV